NPVPTNKPGVEPKRPPRPVNITQMIKLSPTTANTINVSWVHDFGKAYAITVALVHKRNSLDLLQRMKTRGAKQSDHTRGMIKEKLNEDADSEIATTSLRVSLMCPLGKMRMSNPCRARTCQHLQCFDAYLYLQMNERKPTWNCPVCDKPALYDDLDIDGYFQEVLNSPQLNSDINEIQLHKDGSWSIQVETKKPAPAKVVKMNTLDDSIEIISDDVEVITPGNATSTTTERTEKTEADAAATSAESAPVPLKEKSVVDLTLSDSEDDEPLAKRRALNPKPDSTIKFSDTTSISSSSNQSRVSVTPGPSSVSSSGYPVSPGGVITLMDSPSPPGSPAPATAQPSTSQSSCMLSNGSAAAAPNTTNNTSGQMYNANAAMPYLDLENEANSSGHSNYY
ncbi:PREDICTED: E3 SUMO-protein ligase PIAS1-like, partial [Nicrophorus vespilloides]|uniref:E3 SUMO-protein ligase PIAS1-like n=1 Tax=Nicrophorus vespilloides TaxID=110193 RepID=A0ABM1M7V8_NICVS